MATSIHALLESIKAGAPLEVAVTDWSAAHSVSRRYRCGEPLAERAAELFAIENDTPLAGGDRLVTLRPPPNGVPRLWAWEIEVAQEQGWGPDLYRAEP